MNSLNPALILSLGQNGEVPSSSRPKQSPDLSQHFRRATQIGEERQDLSTDHVQRDYKELIKSAHVLLQDSRPMSEEKLRQIYEIIFLFAGKTSLTPPFCSMCFNPGTLANSHIVPNNILAHLGTSFMSSRTPNETKSAAKLAWKLFCTPKCEVDRLSKLGEHGFSQIFHSFIEDVKKARKDQTTASLFISDQSMHYCIASIVFRYMVVSGKGDLKEWINKHGPQVEEKFWRFFFLLRNYVLDKDSPNRPHIQFYIDENEFGKNTLISSICTIPAKRGGEWCTTGHFGFKGFHFLVVESKEFLTKFYEYTKLPPNGFSETITFEPKTIVVKPQHVLTLPYVVNRAFQFDMIVYKKMLARLNANNMAGRSSSPSTGQQQVSVPLHPLVADPVALYNRLPFVTRLPDEIIFNRNSDQLGELEFSLPNKYEIVSSRTEPSMQIWLVRNIPNKQIFAVINDFTKSKQVVCGFSLNQTLFAKKDLDEAMKIIKRIDSDKNVLKNYLGMTPLHKTDHLGIEYVGEGYETQRHILGTLMRYWHSQP